MLDELVRALSASSGPEILAFAPSSSATEVLKKNGFQDAATVQKLLVDSELQARASNKILLVDEAGFLSVREMRQLVQFASLNNSRVILSGDSRQHHSVERGDALRLLEKSGAITSASLNTIFRQQIPALREAIQELAQGRTESGFDKLNSFGAVHEIEDQHERLKAIYSMHLEAVKRNQTSLIVAPTHGECRQIANAIRTAMRKKGILAPIEHTWARLEKLKLTTAQRKDSVSYDLGTVVEFHQRAAGGFKSGDQWVVVSKRDRSLIIVEKDGQQRSLPLSQAAKFNVFRAETISLAVGDQVRITKNFQSQGHKFRNNELHKLTAIQEGRITLGDHVIITDGGLHLDQGIAVTSHASQGKTLDQVIVSVPVAAFSQTNEAQFYVSMSRARSSMHVFTDSKPALKEAVMRTSARLSPHELAPQNSVVPNWPADRAPRIQMVRDLVLDHQIRCELSRSSRSSGERSLAVDR